MKYLFTGITGCRNRGVEALLVTAMEGIRKRDPEATFVILTGDPTYDAWRLQSYGVRAINHRLEEFERDPSRVRTKLERRYLKRGAPYRAIERAVRESDVVVASGGDVFASEYGARNLARKLAILELALDLDKPVVFLGHSIGPFKTREELEGWLRVADRSRLITLREGLSLDYVREHVSLDRDRVVGVADVAFLLEPDRGIAKLLPGTEARNGRPLVAVSISAGMSKYLGGDADAHHAAWLACLNTLVDRLDAEIVLIPHVHDARSLNDDRIPATDLLRAAPPELARRLHLMGGDFRAAEFKGLIAGCDLLIAERMHAAIAGLSTGVPTVAVGYSVKAEGIVKDLFADEELRRWVLVPGEEFGERFRNAEFVDGLWSRREAIRAVLREAAPRLKEAAERNFDALAKALEGAVSLR